jgi:hypothetical protein
LAWYLIRSRRWPGWHHAIPAAVAGAMMPDVKFLRYFLPPRAAALVYEIGDRFHAPFHASPTSVTIGLSLEIVCTLILLGALSLLVRRQDALKRRAQDSNL